MNIYYLDQALDAEELEFIKSTLKKRHGGLSFSDIRQVRVPAVLPAPTEDGSYEENIIERLRIARRNLLRTDIEKQAGAPVIWIMPKGAHWGTVFQLAIQELTGYFPFIVLLWRQEGDQLVRSEARFIDNSGMVTHINDATINS